MSLTGTPLRAALLVIVAAITCVAIACGSSSTTTSSTSKATTTEPSTSMATGSSTTDATPVALKVVKDALGLVVVDDQGRVLYSYAKDTASTSACTGGCATTWPPLTTSGTPTGSGLGATALATITRADGTEQVTLGGHPLYTFSGDSKPGDTNGQGTGGVWYVVGPVGNVMKNALATTTSQAGGGY